MDNMCEGCMVRNTGENFSHPGFCKSCMSTMMGLPSDDVLKGNDHLTKALADNADVAMSEAQVDELVAATMRLADLDGDGKISLHEFRELVRNRPSMLDDFMTVRVGGLVAGAGATAGAAAGHTT